VRDLSVDWKMILNMNFKNWDVKFMEWIQLAQNVVCWRSFVSTEINMWIT
jgi:hypothetical protein